MKKLRTVSADEYGVKIVGNMILPKEKLVNITIKLLGGIIEFYSDLAKFNGMTLERVVNQELEDGAKAIIETLPIEAHFHRKTMLQRYGLE